MIYQENQIRQFQTVFGYNLLSEIEFFVAEPFLLVTMEDLWQKYESKFNINSEYLYFVNSLEIKDLDEDAKKFENIKSIIIHKSIKADISFHIINLICFK